MSAVTRTTRVCSIETLNEDLRFAIRAHGAKYGLDDFESNVLMCCETISLSQKPGLFGGLRTTLSAVYVTPKWLVWADSTGPRDAAAGSAKLKHIDVHNYQTTASFAITPDQGLNVTGRYTDRNSTGMTFIVLSSEPGGEQFRKVLKTAMTGSMKQPDLGIREG